ncbi:hypothetical protein GQ457_13G011550 [Hibiscus cannabinus]
MQSYWWTDKGWPLIAWDKICLRNLDSVNFSQLGKQAWRLLLNQESLVFKVISDAQVENKASYAWSDIHKAM